MASGCLQVAASSRGEVGPGRCAGSAVLRQQLRCGHHRLRSAVGAAHHMACQCLIMLAVGVVLWGRCARVSLSHACCQALHPAHATLAHPGECYNIYVSFDTWHRAETSRTSGKLCQSSRESCGPVPAWRSSTSTTATSRWWTASRWLLEAFDGVFNDA